MQENASDPKEHLGTTYVNYSALTDIDTQTIFPRKNLKTRKRFAFFLPYLNDFLYPA